MVNEKIVGSEFAGTTGKLYIELLEILFAQPWSNLLISGVEILSLFPQIFHEKLSSVLAPFNTDIVRSLSALAKRVIIDTTYDIRDIESMDTVPEVIREFILSNKNQ